MDIKKKSKLFIIETLILFMVMMLLVNIVAHVLNRDLLAETMVGSVFLLVMGIASALVWYWVAKHHKDQLTSFFTGVSGVRFLGALAVFFVWFLVASRESMRQFFVVFLVFYMVSLLHHSIFFSRISNRL